MKRTPKKAPLNWQQISYAKHRDGDHALLPEQRRVLIKRHDLSPTGAERISTEVADALSNSQIWHGVDSVAGSRPKNMERLRAAISELTAAASEVQTAVSDAGLSSWMSYEEQDALSSLTQAVETISAAERDMEHRGVPFLTGKAPRGTSLDHVRTGVVAAVCVVWASEGRNVGTSKPSDLEPDRKPGGPLLRCIADVCRFLTVPRRVPPLSTLEKDVAEFKAQQRRS